MFLQFSICKYHTLTLNNISLKSLGPLINPSLPKTMIVGVHSKNIGLIMAEALKLSKHVERGMVVCGDIGLDEVTKKLSNFK